MMDNANNSSPPKKNPWRFLFGGCALYGGMRLLSPLWGVILGHHLQSQVNITPSKAATIGIIGGADGPTAIFVTTPPWTAYILPAIMLIVGIFGYLRLTKRK